MLRVLSLPAHPGFDCCVVRRGRDVLVLVSDALLGPRTAALITAALSAVTTDLPTPTP